MKTPALLLLLAVPTLLLAQSPAPPEALSLSLPNGKVLHFQTAEQKAKFQAALERRQAQAASPAQPASLLSAPVLPIAQPTPKTSSLGHTALDEQPQTSGKVNVNAPTFTAAYYMAAPDTWVGKHITLSVAYIYSSDEVVRPDGLQSIEASTWGTTTWVADKDSGGSITILAKPDVATNLRQLCGTRLQYNAGHIRTTLLKGEFTVVTQSRGSKSYGVIVEK